MASPAGSAVSIALAESVLSTAPLGLVSIGAPVASCAVSTDEEAAVPAASGTSAWSVLGEGGVVSETTARAVRPASLCAALSGAFVPVCAAVVARSVVLSVAL